MLRTIVINLVVFLVLTVFALASMEAWLRVSGSPYSPADELKFPTPELGAVPFGYPNRQFRMYRPNGEFNTQVAFNTHGLRDANDIVTSTTNDIWVVGDSFIFGWGVSEPERIGNQLAQATGRKVFTLGLPGMDMNTYSKLMAWAVQKSGHKPRAVVLAITTENDILPYHNQKAYEAFYANHLNLAPKEQGLRSVLTGFMFRNSAVYRLLTTAMYQNYSLLALRQQLGLGGAAPTLVAQTNPTVEDIAATAEKVAELGNEYPNITVLLVPSRLLWSDVEHLRTEAVAAHEGLLTALRAEDLSVVDVRPILEAQQQPALGFYFPSDGHWKPEAHALAAQSVAKVLR